MTNNPSEWEKKLSNSPKDKEGFTPELMQRIEERAPLAEVKFKRPMLPWVSGAGAVLLIMLMIFTAQQQEWLKFSSSMDDSADYGGSTGSDNTAADTGEDHAKEDEPADTSSNTPAAEPEKDSSNLFDPYDVEVGSQVKGMTVTAVKDNFFGKDAAPSIMVSFEGKVEISGSFEYVYKDANYNPHNVILQLDAESTARLPRPEAYADHTETRLIVIFDNEADKARFGPPGTSGEVTIMISDYHTLMAESYGGVVDSAQFASLVEMDTIPRDSPEKMNSDYMRNLMDYPELELNPEEAKSADLTMIYNWLKGVSNTFNLGLQLDERRITLEQREQLKPWLHQVFTPSLADALLETNVPKVEGGYKIAGFLDIFPPMPIEGIENPELIHQESDQYRYTIIFKGSEDAATLLTCELVFDNQRWKIANYSYEIKGLNE
jgi:hypothetical protein